MSNEIKKVLVGIPEDLLEQVENYKFENRINNRTQAILDLIKKGLAKEPLE